MEVRLYGVYTFCGHGRLESNIKSRSVSPAL